MFHDAGTNVKSPDSQGKKHRPTLFSFPIIIIIIRASFSLVLVPVSLCDPASCGTGSHGTDDKMLPALWSRCLVRSALGCRLMMCRRQGKLCWLSRCRYSSVCMPRFHRLLLRSSLLHLNHETPPQKPRRPVHRADRPTSWQVPVPFPISRKRTRTRRESCKDLRAASPS